jgi:pimeloyl-ACP methyl ester carboxylesterase
VTGTQGVPDNRQLPLQAQLGYIPVIGEGLMRIVPDSMLESGLASAFAPGYRLPDFALTDLRKLNYSAFDKSPTAFDADIAEKSVPERLQGLDVPVLYIQGEKDQLVDPPTAEESWGSIDGAQVEEISGAGHSPILEATGETTKLMRNFMGAAGKPG